MPSWTTSDRHRVWISAGIAVLGHLILCALFAIIVVRIAVEAPEFVELNVGRLTQRQLTQLVQESERAAAASSPDQRVRAPQKRLPEIDVPVVSPSEEERRLLPERVADDAEKAAIAPPRPAGPAVPPLPETGAARKATYEGAQIDIGPRPGEGIESEHVGSELQPVFLIEGDLKGRKFYEAAVTQVPEVPAQTRIQLDLVVSPSGAVISAIVTRRENAALEAFATNYVRRCRFDPLPSDMPRENQTGRITITFAVRP